MGRVFIPTEETFPRTADAVVIGGGIVGVATAFWLSRAGLDTVLVEMRDGLSTLTTTNSAECFRAQFTEPAMAALAKPSIEIFENFADVIGIPGYDISLHQQGYLFITDDPEMVEQLKEAVEKHHRLGVTDSEFLTGDEVRTRFPYVSPKVVAATFRQRDGWLSAHELTQGFAKGSSAPAAHQSDRYPAGRAGGMRGGNHPGHHRHPRRGERRRPLRGSSGAHGRPRPAAGAGAPPEGVHRPQTADPPGRADDH